MYTACKGGGWQAASDASQASHTEASSGGENNDDEADKRRRDIVEEFRRNTQKDFAEFTTNGVHSNASSKDFAEARAEIISLFGKSEGQSIINQVISELGRSDGKVVCTGKRAKGKASQRKGYG